MLRLALATLGLVRSDEETDDGLRMEGQENQKLTERRTLTKSFQSRIEASSFAYLLSSHFWFSFAAEASFNL